VEIVRQLEAEVQFPQAHYAFDNGVLTLELTRLIESRGKHWVSEVEVSRHTRGRVTGGGWMKWVRSCANRAPREFPEDKGKLSQWGGEGVLCFHQGSAAEAVWAQALGDRA
jgi:hypothetical protein